MLDQPVAVAAVGVARDVIEDDEAFELALEVLRHRGGQRLGFEAPQDLVGVAVSANERLQRAYLQSQALIVSQAGTFRIRPFRRLPY